MTGGWPLAKVKQRMAGQLRYGNVMAHDYGNPFAHDPPAGIVGVSNELARQSQLATMSGAERLAELCPWDKTNGDEPDSEAVSIFVEAASQADWHNGEVFYHAMRASGVTCLHCNYPQNAEKYENLLQQYVDARIERHHAMKSYEKYYGPYGWNPCRAGAHREKLMSMGYNSFVLWDDRCSGLKRVMTPLRPCGTCRVTYNPTRRIRLPKFHFPQLREFLDE